jgi:hypothetical protein
VAELFRMINDAPDFQADPVDYIEKWIKTSNEKNPLEVPYKKVIKRINSIKDSGLFSFPSNFYSKSLG